MDSSESRTLKVEEGEEKSEEVMNVGAAETGAEETEEEEIGGAIGLFSPGDESVDKGALSPLTGSYLLIVLAEPHSEQDREIIIKRLTKGYEEEIERARQVQYPGNYSGFREQIEGRYLGFTPSGRSGVPYWFQRWPYVMPVQIDKKFEAVTRHRIKIALWHLYEAMDKCFKFKIVDPDCEIKGTETKYFVKINRARGDSGVFCSSGVGKLDGGQSISLQWYCDIFAIVHELIHTLGFYHEHTRSDRDKYITVDYALMEKNRVLAGDRLRSWDVDSTHVDLSCELLNLANAAPEGDEARNGEKLVQWASENLVVEVLIHCQVNTLLQCMKNLLSSFTRHRHIIHAGYTFQGTGSWILQDGTFSFTDFVELWEEPEVTRILGAYRGDISVSMHCSEENGWTDERLCRESFTKLCQVRMNPPELLLAHSSGVVTFVDYISKLTSPAPLKEILEPSEIVGNIRFSRPTLYVFPGGQGDAALFGVNGFNMLIDGGFSRRSCFWDFTRHLDRLDAVLLTRVNNNAVGGLDSVLDRKRLNQVYPQIGHFFGNVMERKHPEMEKTAGGEELLVSLTETGQRMLDNLKSINIRPQHCFRDHTIEPINLYHKVGHGKLDMYVLNPAKDSREVREFLSKWNTDCKSFVQARMSVKVEGKERNYPVLNLVSICALLVWQPDNPRDPITRILFPGSTPQQKIFEALGKLKHLEFLKYPVCSAKTIAASHKSRVKSEKVISEAKSQFSSSGIVKDKSGNGESVTTSRTTTRAPSESRVSSKYSYGAVRSKVGSSIRSDSSSTIQTITGESTTTTSTTTADKERKGRERSREKRRVTSSTAKSSDRDNKAVESEVKKTERVSSSRRVDSGLSKTSSSAKVSSTSSKLSSSKVTSRIDTGKKSGQVSGISSPPSRDLKKDSTGTEGSVLKTTVSKSSALPSSKYGIGVARTVVSKASAGSTASPPPTPPKSAKEATNRKVIEHKTQSTRKSLIDSKSKEKTSAVEVKQKTTTSSSTTTKSSSVKSTIPRPSTASAARKSTPNEPVAVKRPSIAGAKGAAAAVGVVAAAGAVVAAVSITSKDEHNGTNGHAEVVDNDSEDVGGKSPVEIEIVDQNGLGLSVPVTESSSELSSLDHLSVNDDQEDNGATGSEEIITELYKDSAVNLETQSETHTITEPGGDNYDEEDEYLIIEKDESAGAEEINIDSNVGAEENVKQIFSKEEYHSPEKEVDEEKDVDEFAEENKEPVEEINEGGDETATEDVKDSVDEGAEPADEDDVIVSSDSKIEVKDVEDEKLTEEIKESVDKDVTKEAEKYVQEVEEDIEKSKAHTDDQELPEEIGKSSELHSEEEIPEPEKSRKEEIPDFEASGMEMDSEETIIREHKVSEPEKEVRALRDDVEISSQLGDRLSAERDYIPLPGKTIQDEEPEETDKDVGDDGITEEQIIPGSRDLTQSSPSADKQTTDDTEPELKQQDKDEIVKPDEEEIEPKEISNLSKSPVPEDSETLVSDQKVLEKSSDEHDLPLTPQPSLETEEIVSEIEESEKPKGATEAEDNESGIQIDQASIKSSTSREQLDDKDVPEKDILESEKSGEEFQSSEPEQAEPAVEIKSSVRSPSIHDSKDNEIPSDDKGTRDSETPSEIQAQEVKQDDSLVPENEEQNLSILKDELIKSTESIASAGKESEPKIKFDRSGSLKSDGGNEELQATLPQFPDVPSDEIPAPGKSETKDQESDEKNDDNKIAKETEQVEKNEEKDEKKSESLEKDEITREEKSGSKTPDLAVEESIESKSSEMLQSATTSSPIEPENEQLELEDEKEAGAGHSRVKRSLNDTKNIEIAESGTAEASEEKLAVEDQEIPVISKSDLEINEEKSELVSDSTDQVLGQDSDDGKKSPNLTKEELNKSNENLQPSPSPSLHEMVASVECVTLKDMDTEKESKKPESGSALLQEEPVSEKLETKDSTESEKREVAKEDDDLVSETVERESASETVQSAKPDATEDKVESSATGETEPLKADADVEVSQLDIHEKEESVTPDLHESSDAVRKSSAVSVADSLCKDLDHIEFPREHEDLQGSQDSLNSNKGSEGHEVIEETKDDSQIELPKSPEGSVHSGEAATLPGITPTKEDEIVSQEIPDTSADKSEIHGEDVPGTTDIDIGVTAHKSDESYEEGGSVNSNKPSEAEEKQVTDDLETALKSTSPLLESKSSPQALESTGEQDAAVIFDEEAHKSETNQSIQDQSPQVDESPNKKVEQEPEIEATLPTEDIKESEKSDKRPSVQDEIPLVSSSEGEQKTREKSPTPTEEEVILVPDILSKQNMTLELKELQEEVSPSQGSDFQSADIEQQEKQTEKPIPDTTDVGEESNILSQEGEISKDAKTPLLTQVGESEVEQTVETKDVQEVKDSLDVKDEEESKDIKNVEESKDVDESKDKDVEESKDIESKDDEESTDLKKHEDVEVTKEGVESKHVAESKKVEESKDEVEEAKDIQESTEETTKDTAESKDVKDDKDIDEVQESKDIEQSKDPKISTDVGKSTDVQETKNIEGESVETIIESKDAEEPQVIEKSEKVKETSEVKTMSIESRIESMRKEGGGQGWIETESEVPEETEEEIDTMEKDIAKDEEGAVKIDEQVPPDMQELSRKSPQPADEITSKEMITTTATESRQTGESEMSQKSEIDESARFDISVKLDETQSESAKETSPDSLRTDELDLALEQHRRRLSAANEESIKSRMGEETSQDENILTDDGKDQVDIETSRESQFGSLNEDEQQPIDDFPIGDEVLDKVTPVQEAGDDAQTPVQAESAISPEKLEESEKRSDIPSPTIISKDKEIELDDQIDLPVEVTPSASGVATSASATLIDSKDDKEPGKEDKVVEKLGDDMKVSGTEPDLEKNKTSIKSPQHFDETKEAEEEVESDKKGIETESKGDKVLPVTTTQPEPESPVKPAEPPVSVKAAEIPGDSSTKPYKPVPSAIPPKIPRESREVIRTPDEVADLPVHEEVEPGTYETDFFHDNRHEKMDTDEDVVTSDAGDQLVKSPAVPPEELQEEEKAEEIVSATATTTATAPASITAAGTTFTSSVTHTTKDEESPAPDFRLLSHDDKVTESLDKTEKSEEKPEELAEIGVVHSLPPGVVEKIDAAVSPVLESLLTKSVGKALERAEIIEEKVALESNEKAIEEDEPEISGKDEPGSASPGEIREPESARVESDKYSTASPPLQQLPSKVEDESGTMQTKEVRDDDEINSKTAIVGDKSVDVPSGSPAETPALEPAEEKEMRRSSNEELVDKTEQIEEQKKKDEGLTGEIELEEPQSDVPTESIPFVLKAAGSITSVVITPSTPPVQVADDSLFLLPPQTTTTSGDSNGNSPTAPDDGNDKNDNAPEEGRLTPEDPKLFSDLDKMITTAVESSPEKLTSEEKVEKSAVEPDAKEISEEIVASAFEKLTSEEKLSPVDADHLTSDTLKDTTTKPADDNDDDAADEPEPAKELISEDKTEETAVPVVVALDSSKTTDKLIDTDKSPSSTTTPLTPLTGSSLLVEETKMSTSEESSSSSALTAIVETTKEMISSIMKPDGDDKSDQVPTTKDTLRGDESDATTTDSKITSEIDKTHQVPSSKSPSETEIVGEKREKLFFLPRDEDDEDNEDEGVEEDGENYESDQPSNVFGIVGAGLLNAANTLNAAVVHQSTEEIAVIPSPERQRSPDGGSSPQRSAEEVIKTEICSEKSDLESKVAPEPENLVQDEKEVSPPPLETGHISPAKVDADKSSKFSAESTDSVGGESEDKSGILKPDDHKEPGSEDEMEVTGKTLVTAIGETITSSAGVILSSLMGLGQDEKISAKSPEKVVFSDTRAAEIWTESGDSEEPISETLIQTAHSAVSTALESATQTLEVAESTVDEVQKSAQERLNTLLDADVVDKSSEVVEEILRKSVTVGSEIEESFTSATAKVQECSKDVQHMAGKICDSMKTISHEGVCSHDSDDDGGPEVVEELCTQTVLPPRVIFKDDEDDTTTGKESGKKTPEDLIKSSMKTMHHETPDEAENVEETKVSSGSTEDVTIRTTEEIQADLEDQMLSDTFGFVTESKSLKEEVHTSAEESSKTKTTESISFTKETIESSDPGQVKSPILDPEETTSEESKAEGNESVTQQIEAKEQSQKKRKELTDYIGTIKEAKAVFDTLLNVAKSGAALSSAVEECKQNAVEAIRRHLEEANEVYRPANTDPVAPDSPVEEEGITIYESLEQMALAGCELFTGLVEKIEKDIEENVRREEDDQPETPDETQRRLSAELAVNAALQHLHETFKTMQTMGSPKRSSFHAATCKRQSKLATCTSGEHQEEEEDMRSVSSGRFSQSAMTSSLHLSTSATLAESTIKSPDDETERSEGETMRESMASFTSGVGSDADDRPEFLGSSVTESVTVSQESSETEKVEGHSSEMKVKEQVSEGTSRREEQEVVETIVSSSAAAVSMSTQEFSSSMSQASEKSELTSSRKTSAEESKSNQQEILASSTFETSSIESKEEASEKSELVSSRKTSTEESKLQQQNILSSSTFETSSTESRQVASEKSELVSSRKTSTEESKSQQELLSSSKHEASKHEVEELVSSKSATIGSSTSSFLASKDAEMSSVSAEVLQVEKSSISSSFSSSSAGQSSNLIQSSSVTIGESSSSGNKKSGEVVFGSEEGSSDHEEREETTRKVVYYEEKSGAEPSSLKTVTTTTTSVSPGGSVTKTTLSRRFSSSGEPLEETTEETLTGAAKYSRRASEVQSSQFGPGSLLFGGQETGDLSHLMKKEDDSRETDTRPQSDFGYQTRESGDEESGSYQSGHGYATMVVGGQDSSKFHQVIREEVSGDPTMSMSTTTFRTVTEEMPDGSQKVTTVRTITGGFEDLSEFQKASWDSSGFSSSDFGKSNIVQTEAQGFGKFGDFQTSSSSGGTTTVEESSSGFPGFGKSTIVRTVSQDSRILPGSGRSMITRTVSEDSGALPSSERSTVVRTISSESGTRSFPEFDKSSTIRTVTTTSGSDDGSGMSKSTIISSSTGSQQHQQYYPAFPQDILEEEAYSSGDFSDSQPSSIPTGHVETDEEVHNFEPSGSSKGDLDNGNYSTTTVVTSDNGSVTTQTFVTSSSSGNNGNTTTQTTRVVTTSRTITTDDPNAVVTTTETSETSGAQSSSHSDILKEWGKPLGLPVVYTDGAEGGSNGPDSGNFGGKATPKKTPGGSKGPGTPAKSASGASTKDKRSSSRKSRHSPIYVDLAYVPHHGNSHYCDSEFFRMIRGRYYVFSGLEPSREVFEGLLEGKQQWEDKNLETTVIPTYDTDTLGYWVGDSEKELAEAKIDLAPSASRCTINLQDHETSCAAYRLEF